MAARRSDRLDIIIFGATGITGMYCIPYMHKLAKEKGRNLSWGISGRSNEKLKQTLAKMADKIDADLSEIPIILAEIEDEESLLKLAKQTKILINCCGPYRFYGEPVVKACIEAGTHYVDVSAETQFIETVQLKYDKAAKEKGVYMVSACGWESVPNDLGLVYFENQFNGTLNSVVTYLEYWEEGGNTSGPIANYTTWESLVYWLLHFRELSEIHKKLYPDELPKFKPKLKPKLYPCFPVVGKGWSLPFPSPDGSCLPRTQRYFYENENKRPVQIDVRFLDKNYFFIIGIIFQVFIWILLVHFKFGRNLLLNYPHMFSLGMFRKNLAPTEEKLSRTVYKTTFYGEGWKEKLANKNDEYPDPPNRCFIAKIKGKNPAYGATCVSVVGSAIMIASEQEKLPKEGGVYSPGAMFAKTSLIQILQEDGISFEMVSQEDIA